MAADFVGLPPAYSFVADSEPFYAETVRYFDSLRAAGVPAELDIYHTNMHAFDMMRPRDAQSVAAAEAFERQFADARARYFAPQEKKYAKKIWMRRVLAMGDGLPQPVCGLASQ